MENGALCVQLFAIFYSDQLVSSYKGNVLINSKPYLPVTTYYLIIYAKLLSFVQTRFCHFSFVSLYKGNVFINSKPYLPVTTYYLIIYAKLLSFVQTRFCHLSFVIIYFM